jgi:hypothetical protein
MNVGSATAESWLQAGFAALIALTSP